MKHKNALPPFNGTSVQTSLIDFRAAMPPEVTEISFRQERSEGLDRGLKKLCLLLVDRCTEFSFDATGTMTKIERATEPRFENGAVNENFTNGND
jgi:hypothetical protein